MLELEELAILSHETNRVNWTLLRVICVHLCDSAVHKLAGLLYVNRHRTLLNDRIDWIAGTYTT